MHPRQHRTYRQAVELGITDNIDLESAADALLRKAGAGDLTTRAFVSRERYRRSRWPAASIDNPGMYALVDNGDPFAGNESEDSIAAVSMFGTERERRIYHMDQRGYTRRQIATILGMDLSTVSRSVQRCRDYVIRWLDQVEGWRAVYRAEIAGKPLPVDELAEGRELEHAILRLNKMDIEIAQLGGDSYQIANNWVLRSDQIITLVQIGEVRTHQYGMVTL